jgi:hypothetical protein
MTKFFICIPKNIQTKLRELRKVGSSENDFTDLFTDNTDQSTWLLTRYETDFLEGGVDVLKRENELSISELIELAITSQFIEEVIGASLELYDREAQDGDIFREELVNRLALLDLTNLTDFDKKRIEIIIYESSIYDPLNRREIIGKSMAEIEEDASFYRRISGAAKTILKMIK